MGEQAESGTGFLNFSTVDPCGQMDDFWLCVGGSPLHHRKFNSSFGLSR